MSGKSKAQKKARNGWGSLKMSSSHSGSSCVWAHLLRLAKDAEYSPYSLASAWFIWDVFSQAAPPPEQVSAIKPFLGV